MVVSADQDNNAQEAVVDFTENDSVSRTSNRLEGLLAPAKRKDMP